MDMNERDANFLTYKQDFAYFLAPDNGDSLYGDKVEEMLRDDEKRLKVDLNHIAQYDPELRKNILANPMDYVPAWEEALKDYIDHHDFIEKDLKAQAQQSTLSDQFKIGLYGNFGHHRTTPQRLLAENIGNMVCLEGIVTKTSLIRPKVLETVHFCEATQEYHTQKYRDATSIGGGPTTSAYPTTDSNGNPLTTEFGMCTYMDHQTIVIQDMPERTEAGSMPQTVECILDDDLVDSCKPGDRVQMVGIYRALSGASASGQASGRFRTVVLVNNVVKIGQSSESEASTLLTANDIRNIKKEAKTKNVFDMLANSVVPSIYGHDYIKKAIVLQLLGGNEKNLDNGTHIRGDVNILMVGDPSCGKSQLLRGVMNIAPLAINTTGRGSSGVGLTAAVTTDKDSGVKRLEAGAMVLADRGIVMIDEFDKMTDVDRTAIHEVMEQQTVTIAKAGIHTSLNARCSVIAAANPVYGMYDRSRKPHENIGLPDSLLSRFDLLFIVLDKIDTKIDRNISDHVLNMHLTPGNDNLGDMDDIDYGDEDSNSNKSKKKKVTPIYSKLKVMNPKTNRSMKLYSIPFCKKYIEFAKKNMKPKLTDRACEQIAQMYGSLREETSDLTLPITARCLETIIRLSTAHAKLRLSKKITETDVRGAMEVLQFALTHDAAPREGGDDDDDENVDMEDDEDQDEDEDRRKRRRRDKKRRKKKRGGKEEDDSDLDEDSEAKMSEDHSKGRRKRKLPHDSQLEKDGRRKKRARSTKSNTNSASEAESESEQVAVNPKRSLAVSREVALYFRKTRVTHLNLNDIHGRITESDEQNVQGMSVNELRNILEDLYKRDKLFFKDDTVHQI